MISKCTFLTALILATCLHAIAHSQETPAVQLMSPDPYPLYICRINVTDSKNTKTTQDIQGNQGNAFSFTSVKKFQSTYCTCVGLAFAKPNFQGKYSELNLAGGKAQLTLKFVAQSYILTCLPSVRKDGFIKV